MCVNKQWIWAEENIQKIQDLKFNYKAYITLNKEVILKINTGKHSQQKIICTNTSL